MEAEISNHRVMVTVEVVKLSLEGAIVKKSIGSASGFDGVPVAVLRFVWNCSVVCQFQHCFKLSTISRANFPSYWKFAMIRPISKAGSKKYRPIYLLRQPRRKSLRKLSHGFSKADPVVQNSQPLARIAKLIAITLYPHPKARKLFVSSSIYSKLLQSHRCVRFHGFFATFVPVPTS